MAQADIIIPGAGDSQAWDRFAYVKNSPVVYTDPTGHLSEKEICRYFGYCNKKDAQKGLGANLFKLLWETDITWGDTILIGSDKTGADIYATLVLFANTNDNTLTAALWNINTGERVQWSTAQQSEYVAAYSQKHKSWYSSDQNGQEWCNRDTCKQWAGGNTPTTHIAKNLFLDEKYEGYGLSNYYYLDFRSYALAGYGAGSLLLGDPKSTVGLVADLAALAWGASDLAPKAAYPIVSFIHPQSSPPWYVPLMGFTSTP